MMDLHIYPEGIFMANRKNKWYSHAIKLQAVSLSFLPDKTKAFLLSSEGKQRKARLEWLICMLKTYKPGRN